jgi:DNA-binding response OmpR family regulator
MKDYATALSVVLFDSAASRHTTGGKNMPLAPKKVLIVEDEPDIAQLVKLYLEKEGFHTNVAKSGGEALKFIKSERPDLLILDLMLPEIDGIEVCKKIRTAPDTALLPIIMLRPARNGTSRGMAD